MEHPQNDTPATTDPFGRMIPGDGSQDRFRDMNNVATLEAAVGPTDDNRPDDVAKTEILLDQIGFLDLRETEGPTGFYGERLRAAIIALQRQLGLTENGRIVPGDPTHMALQRSGVKDTGHNRPGVGRPPAPANIR